MNCWVLFIWRLRAAGLTSIESRVITVRVVVPKIVPVIAVAIMSVTPAETPVAVPALEIVALPVDELQTTDNVISASEPSE